MSEDWVERRRQNDLVRKLLADLEKHSPGERGHAERVAVYATAIGHELGIERDDLLHLRWAAQLHDIGKLAIPSGLLRSSERLGPEEIDKMRGHATLYERPLFEMAFLGPSLPMIRHHHERWDGAGYPDGLIGSDIPLGARAIGAAEAFDVLTIAPPWRASLSEEDAMAEMRACTGSQFDPEVIEALAKAQLLIQPLIDNGLSHGKIG